MWANPMTYSVALLNHTLGLPNAYPGVALSLIVTIAYGLALLLASGVLAAQSSTRSSA
jgi:hypothetical protein